MNLGELGSRFLVPQSWQTTELLTNETVRFSRSRQNPHVNSHRESRATQ
jgi:hypothetical protein